MRRTASLLRSTTHGNNCTRPDRPKRLENPIPPEADGEVSPELLAQHYGRGRAPSKNPVACWGKGLSEGPGRPLDLSLEAATPNLQKGLEQLSLAFCRDKPRTPATGALNFAAF